MSDDVGIKIVSLLKKKTEGLTITDMVKLSSFSRSAVRTGLARLEGANKVEIRQVGMAKIYKLRKNK